MPVKYLFLDEIDAYPGDSGGEGDPVLLIPTLIINEPNKKHCRVV